MRARTHWLVFSAAVATLLAVLGAATWGLLRFDARRVQTEHDALREELVRLSLWRMDSAITPMLAREIAEAGRPIDGPNPVGVRARFVIHPGGDAEPLDALEGVERDALLALLAQQSPRDTAVAVAGATIEVASSYRSSKQQRVESAGVITQNQRNSLEYGKRVASLQENLANSSLRNPANELDEGDVEQQALAAAYDVPPAILETMRPLWWGEDLVLVRRVRGADGERLEGAWLDWPAVRELLRAEVADLLPDAQLRPLLAGEADDQAHRLATLPLGVEAGVLSLPHDPAQRPLWLAIAAAWMFVVVAIAAVASLLRGSMNLSERRAAFVSAVTHELRTPLTTFRMYTEMLESGMVEAKRQQYVSTLRREAERLGQLVENVLSYARIEADRHERELESITIEALVERVADRLEQRCRGAGFELELELLGEGATASVAVDVTAVEQILFNLVDNAAKYGATAVAPKVQLSVRIEPAVVILAVSDAGPGIPVGERARVFEPFAKGSAHASGTKPGVGLGLALSRRLAVQMRGRLELVASDRGACFELVLPRAPVTPR